MVNAGRIIADSTVFGRGNPKSWGVRGEGRDLYKNYEQKSTKLLHTDCLQACIQLAYK